LSAPSIRAASCVADRAWIKALCRQGGEALQRGWPVYAASAERDQVGTSWRQDEHYWSTSKSAAFLAAVVVVALMLAGLLALVIELR